MTLHMGEFTTALQAGSDGIWRAQSQKAISYPEEGNADCFNAREGNVRACQVPLDRHHTIRIGDHGLDLFSAV